MRSLSSFSVIPRLAALTALLVTGGQAWAASLAVGCPWIPDAIDNSTQNSGYPDKASTYSIATLPTNPAAGTVLRIHGLYPQVRYFSFQIADRSRATPPYDQISDATLISDEGGTPPADPAQLPSTAGYTAHYTITIRFENVPAVREPNTLYAGVPAAGDPLKQLLMRNYLPNPGTDSFGNTPLPDLVLVAPNGSQTDLNQTTDKLPCHLYSLLWTHVPSVTNWATFAPKRPRFYASSGAGLVLYPNGDSTYIGAPINHSVAPLIIMRGKAPTMPAVPPEITANPEVRYWSLCENELRSTASVGCIADRDVVVGSDGYFTLVVSSPAQRPSTATAAKGYNWLDWGAAQDGLLVMRQILPAPGFAGNYLNAVVHPLESLSRTLGIWAPDISYCDSATFAANADAGGAAVIAACQAATR